MPVVTAISCKLPKKKIDNSHFYNFHDINYVDKASALTGVKTRYWAESETTLSLCVEAAQDLINNHSNKTKNSNLRDEIDLIIFITQTPEFLMPGICFQAHDLLNLSDNCGCLTLNAGCTSYVDGINLSFDLIKSRCLRNVLLLVGDVLSKYLDLNDYSTSSVFGDAGTATLISATKASPKNIFLDGKIPNSSDALKLNFPFSKDDPYLRMDGLNVFTFAINNIHLVIKEAKRKWYEEFKKKSNIDFYLLHQANNMITSQISKKMNIPEKIIPTNISQFGNTSGATLPLLICSLDKNLNTKNTLLLCGFGVGLSWSIMITNCIDIKYKNIF